MPFNFVGFLGVYPQTYIGRYTYISLGVYPHFDQNTKFTLTCLFKIFNDI